MSSVTVNNVSKAYPNGFKALDSVNLEVQDGEFLVLLGPSGCGKTTLLRTIAGLETATDGEIYIGDRLVNYLAPRDRDIAMVFQSYALYPHMSVEKNMTLSLKLRKVERTTVKDRLGAASEALGLSRLLERMPGQLSGGQQQRVALGRAIARVPKVFLMDEPLSNLDSRLRLGTRTEIVKLHRRLGATTIYVTHDQGEAMTMATRIVVMKDGVVQQIGTPLEIYRRPVNRFVAGFLGSPEMNFLEASVVRDDGGAALTGPAFRFPLSADRDILLAERGLCDVWVGVRPEALRLAAEPSAGCSLSGVVDVVEPLGRETLLYCSVGDATVVAQVGPDVEMEVGQAIAFTVEPGDFHIFERTGGEAAVV